MRRCEWDERGWRVPAEGTKSRQIYDLMVAGTAPVDIAYFLSMPRVTVRVLMWKMRHPNASNHAMQVWRKTGERRRKYRTYFRRYRAKGMQKDEAAMLAEADAQ